MPSPKPHTLSVRFPTGGINRQYARQDQPPFTTYDCLNVWPFQGNVMRQVGGNRPGVRTAFDQQLGGTGGKPIRLLGDMRYLSANTLVTRVIASANGALYHEEPAGTMTAVANMNGLSLSTTQQIGGVDFQQKFFIADWDPDETTSAADRVPKVYDPATDTLATWQVDDYPEDHPQEGEPKGALPLGCPIITLYHNRVVLAGARSNPHNVYMSRVGDPFDWDTGVVDDTGAALAFNLSEGGEVGDWVTCLAPHTQDCMIIGCPTSLWMMRGDPADGGRLHLLDDRYGVIGPQAWCHAPAEASGQGERMFVFMSYDGVYAIPADCYSSGRPQSVSRDRMPAELCNLNPDLYTVSLAYDTVWRGVHVFVTRNDGAGTDLHWFIDWTTKGCFPVCYGAGEKLFDPFVATASRTPSNYTLLGCRDGYIRRYPLPAEVGTTTVDSHAHNATTAFASYVFLGPFTVDGMGGRNEGVLSAISYEGGGGTGSVLTLETRGARSAAEAMTVAARHSRSLQAGQNPTFYPRVRGSDFSLKAIGANSQAWNFERMLVTFEPMGPRRFPG